MLEDLAVVVLRTAHDLLHARPLQVPCLAIALAFGVVPGHVCLGLAERPRSFIGRLLRDNFLSVLLEAVAREFHASIEQGFSKCEFLLFRVASTLGIGEHPRCLVL